MKTSWTAATLLCTAFLWGAVAARRKILRISSRTRLLRLLTPPRRRLRKSRARFHRDRRRLRTGQLPPFDASPPRGRPQRPGPRRRLRSCRRRHPLRRQRPRQRPAARGFEVTAPANSSLSLELMTALSSETAQVEDPVRARLRAPLMVDGDTVLPAGVVLSGNVVDVARAGRVQGRSRLVFRFTEVELNGAREELRTNPVTFEGEATKGEDATKIGAGAVGGAIVGGILGGGSGAAKGAAIGGAAGTGVVLATRGRDVTVASGADVATTLATPVLRPVLHAVTVRDRLACPAIAHRRPRPPQSLSLSVPSQNGLVVEAPHRQSATGRRPILRDAIPVDDLHVVAFNHIRTILAKTNGNHQLPRPGN